MQTRRCGRTPRRWCAGCSSWPAACAWPWGWCEALLASRTFGPVILEWRRHRSVPYRTKLSAIALMSLTLGISIVFFVPLLWAQVLLALFGLGMAVWMYRLPSRDRPRR